MLEDFLEDFDNSLCQMLDFLLLKISLRILRTFPNYEIPGKPLRWIAQFKACFHCNQIEVANRELQHVHSKSCFVAFIASLINRNNDSSASRIAGFTLHQLCNSTIKAERNYWLVAAQRRKRIKRLAVTTNESRKRRSPLSFSERKTLSSKFVTQLNSWLWWEVSLNYPL